MAGMETNDNRSPPPTASEHRLDATAIEALSAGIGLGSLVTKKKKKHDAPAALTQKRRGQHFSQQTSSNRAARAPQFPAQHPRVVL